MAAAVEREHVVVAVDGGRHSLAGGGLVDCQHGKVGAQLNALVFLERRWTGGRGRRCGGREEGAVQKKLRRERERWAR